MSGATRTVRGALVLACACLAAVLLPGAAGASRGTIVVATSTASGPHVRGADVDLARAIANVLGYRVSLVDAAPSTIVPRLASGRYDLGMSVVDTAAKERTVDVVTPGPSGAATGIAV